MFSKIYKKVTEKLIDTTMNKYLSPFTSTYQQNYTVDSRYYEPLI